MEHWKLISCQAKVKRKASTEMIGRLSAKDRFLFSTLVSFQNNFYVLQRLNLFRFKCCLFVTPTVAIRSVCIFGATFGLNFLGELVELDRTRGKQNKWRAWGVHLHTEIMLLYHNLSPGSLESEMYSWVLQGGKFWKL